MIKAKVLPVVNFQVLDVGNSGGGKHCIQMLHNQGISFNNRHINLNFKSVRFSSKADLFQSWSLQASARSVNQIFSYVGHNLLKLICFFSRFIFPKSLDKDDFKWMQSINEPENNMLTNIHIIFSERNFSNSPDFSFPTNLSSLRIILPFLLYLFLTLQKLSTLVVELIEEMVEFQNRFFS